MESNLVTFGCSATYGQSLSDIHPDNEQPSKLAWPQVLGDLANIPVVNMAYKGSSNKEIAHHVLNYNYNTDDIVVICWTFTDRFCVIRKDNILRLGVWHANPSKFATEKTLNEKQQVSTAFFSNVHDDNDMSLNQHYCIHYANLFLDSKKIKNYHIILHNYLRKDYKFFDTKILEIDYLELIKNNPLAMDNDHPGEMAHKLLAQDIFKETKGLTL